MLRAFAIPGWRLGQELEFWQATWMRYGYQGLNRKPEPFAQPVIGVQVLV